MSRVARELLEAVILALIVFLLVQTSIRNFKVDGSSMHPTLEGGQYLLVNKLVYFRIDTKRLSRIIPFWDVERPSRHFAFHPPRRGEVIVFRFPVDPKKDFVKRVVGLPGEEVKLREGKVYVDDVALVEPYLTGDSTTVPVPNGRNRWRLGKEEYFVLGDNRGSSNDSRTWGAVPEKNVVGKVWVVYWPFSELQLLSPVSSVAREIPR